MKRFQKHPITCILLAAILTLQSCVVYQKAPVTFDEAVARHRKVKLLRTNGETIKFKRIAFEDPIYYGIRGTRSEVVKVPLNPADISSIRVKDPTKSTVGTVLLSLGIGLLTAFIIYAISFDSNWLGTITFE